MEYNTNLSWRLKQWLLFLFFPVQKQTQRQAQIKTKLESGTLSLTSLPIVLCQFLNREFCPSACSTPAVLSAEPFVTGALKDGKRGPYEHEHQDPHAPKHTSPSSGTLRERDDPLLCPGVASSYLQPSVADRLFIGYTRCLSHGTHGWTSQLLASSRSVSSSSSSCRGSGVWRASSRRKAGE